MSDLRPLADYTGEREIVTPLPGWLHGEPIGICAVLQRTAVFFKNDEDDRHLARLEEVMVRQEDVRYAVPRRYRGSIWTAKARASSSAVTVRKAAERLAAEADG